MKRGRCLYTTILFVSYLLSVSYLARPVGNSKKHCGLRGGQSAWLLAIRGTTPGNEKTNPSGVSPTARESTTRPYTTIFNIQRRIIYNIQSRNHYVLLRRFVFTSYAVGCTTTTYSISICYSQYMCSPSLWNSINESDTGPCSVPASLHPKPKPKSATVPQLFLSSSGRGRSRSRGRIEYRPCESVAILRKYRMIIRRLQVKVVRSSA